MSLTVVPCGTQSLPVGVAGVECSGSGDATSGTASTCVSAVEVVAESVDTTAESAVVSAGASRADVVAASPEMGVAKLAQELLHSQRHCGGAFAWGEDQGKP